MRRAATVAMLAAATALIVPAAARAPDSERAGVVAFAGSEANAERCGAVDPSGRFTTGGCPAKAYASDALLTVRNGLGAFDFGACTTSMDVNIDGRGRIWMDRIGLGGASPCNDVRPCAPQAVLDTLDNPSDATPQDKAFPWKGQIERAISGGRFKGMLSLCIDTCIGRYEGQIPIVVLRADGSWRIRADRVGVDTSGMEIDIDWKLNDEARLDLRSAP